METTGNGTGNSSDSNIRTNLDEPQKDVAMHLLAAVVIVVILTSLLLSCILARHRIKQVRFS